MELDVNKTYYGDYFATYTLMKLLLCEPETTMLYINYILFENIGTYPIYENRGMYFIYENTGIYFYIIKYHIFYIIKFKTFRNSKLFNFSTFSF